jgi:hypothetical protein
MASIVFFEMLKFLESKLEFEFSFEEPHETWQALCFLKCFGVFSISPYLAYDKEKRRKRKGRQVFTLGKAGPNSGKAHGLGLLPTLTPKT